MGIKHARSLVKARHPKNPLPTAPLCMIDGAAGSGKSRTISILKQFIQAILQQSGDNVDCPHVLVCAPTGLASFCFIKHNTSCMNCRYSCGEC